MLAFQIFSDSSLTFMLADFTNRVQPPDGRGLRFSTNDHGFAALEAGFIPMTLQEAFECYTWPGLPHAIVTDHESATIWEGRVEDVAIVEGGIRLTAFGYQRALYDVPYTALWSKSGSGDWRFITSQDQGAFTNERYEGDNNNRLYIAPRNGESFDTGTDSGGFTYAVPHNSARDITNIALDYVLELPANWRFIVASYEDDFTSGNTLNTVTATGGIDSAVLGLTLGTPQPRVVVYIRNNTGSTSTISADTGTNYFKATDLRIKSTTSSTVVASEIVAGIVAYINGINGDQLSADESLIEATTEDLQDEIYEDEWPGDIFDRLAQLHTYEWGVYEGRRVYFRARGSGGRAWYVDATEIINLERSLENVRNSAYGIYRDADGRTLRTNTVGDADSQGRYGVLRRGFISVQTTSLGEAQVHRSTWLADKADASARAEVRFNRLYDVSGALYPLYALRAGDTITIRNLSPSLSGDVDRIRTFVVAETEYDAAEDSIRVSPEMPIPSLDRLVARREAGL